MNPLYSFGIFPALLLTSAEVCALTEEGERELIDDLGATPAMLEQLRALAQVPGRRMILDFEYRTVTLVE